MDSELSVRLTVLEAKVEDVHKYVKRLYNIFLWTGIVTVAMFVLPLIGMMFVIPSFISSYTSMGNIDTTSTGQSQDTLNAVNNYAQQIQSLLH